MTFPRSILVLSALLLPPAPAQEEAGPLPLLFEAESFTPMTPGWEAKAYGANYYVGTFANTFLSRKAFLGAPEQIGSASASLDVAIPEAGTYLALVRYEAAYRFETRFRLKIEQAGEVKLDRLYGARENLKIWAFGQKLKKEVAWSWGATENIVWEGHDARVELRKGPARLTLLAGPQPGDAARRNVDVVMLTRNEADVRRRIEKERYLPLDGLLTQAGDVFFRLHNGAESGALTLQVPNGTEHSPYWVHLRTWSPKTLKAAPGASTGWTEVGSLLDSLNDGQWNLKAKGLGRVSYDLEAGIRNDEGGIDSIRRFDGLTGSVTLAYDADTRASRRIRLADEVLYELVSDLEWRRLRGRGPIHIPVFGLTFPPRPEDERYTKARDALIAMIGANALSGAKAREDIGQGYIDVRGKGPDALEKICADLKKENRDGRIAVVSLGDEIGLKKPPKEDHEGFRAWLRETGRSPSDLAAEDWEAVRYTGDRSRPELYTYSRLYEYRYGIRNLKTLTDILRRNLPNAGIGANFSPHHSPVYLGATHKWVSLFREGGMTMPWSEDYIFQMPVATPQMNLLSLDLFRAGVRGDHRAKIHFYVMPHWPGNSPAAWKRQFYGALAHGARMINLFEFRPVQAAYTENHVDHPHMYEEVARSLRELKYFEMILPGGRPVRARTALWFSEAADVWDDNASPFDAGKRTLYAAVRHHQLPLDVVVEGDRLTDYRVLYLTDRHVSRKASEAIARWVERGGRLFATAGAGMFDEFDRPNPILRKLLGVDQKKLEIAPGPPVRLCKQDLPFAEPIDRAAWDGAEIPVIGVRSHVEARNATVEGRFSDGAPAVTVRTAGRGRAMYCAFLPGLSYFKPALPRRPVDRGHRADTMAQFLPTKFDDAASRLIGTPAEKVTRPVVCSEPLVESVLIESDEGTVILLINWTGKQLWDVNLTVKIHTPGFDRARLAGRRRVREWEDGADRVFTFDLDVANALILR